MAHKTIIAALVLLCASSACTESDVPAQQDQRDNILLIIADDLGVDRVGIYAEHPDPGRTPRIDQLAADGVLFRNAWANPVCSPTRATILTGKYCQRTGVGHYVNQFTKVPGLDTTKHKTIAQLLQPTHRTAAVGKWHLASHADPDYASHPNRSGFDYYAGSLYNLFGFQADCDGDQQPDVQGYNSWIKTTQGIETPCHKVYATTDTTDEAIAFMDRCGAEPWFLYVAYNAPHTPFHRPPDALHSYASELDAHPLVKGNEALYMKAMTEAMDTEIGRLLEHIPASVRERTTILFVGDNGTTGAATSAPFDPARAKTTVYEGGLNVPLIVVSPRVSPQHRASECKALVNTTDIFATVAGIAGIEANRRDSVSLLGYLANPAMDSQRDLVYAELFQDNGPGPYRIYNRATRGPRFKLIEQSSRSAGTDSAFYDLHADPFENNNLLEDDGSPLTPEQSAELDRLRNALQGER